MRKLTPKRLLSLFLALLMLFGTSTTVAYAANPTEDAKTESGTLTDLERLKELLNTRSYEDYLKRFADAAVAKQEVVVPIDKVVCDDAKIAEISDYPNISISPMFKKESKDNLDSILANFKYDKYEIVDDGDYFYIILKTKAEANGKVVELTDSGSASFSFDVPEAGMYSVVIEYYPIVAKSANIERMFLINDKVLYSESRSISMTKTWTNLYYAKYDANGEVLVDEKGNIQLEYRKDVQGNDIRAEAVQTPKWRSYTVTDASGYYNSLMFHFFGISFLWDWNEN